jgi:hypothetical protein
MWTGRLRIAGVRVLSGARGADMHGAIGQGVRYGIIDTGCRCRAALYADGGVTQSLARVRA